jgi:uncharacterized protein YabN with tetrapyrrole methylase and pyrophosphatase domain
LRAVGELAGAGAQSGSEDERFESAGDLLFAAVDAARAAGVDPELALRAAADRFRERHQRRADA